MTAHSVQTLHKPLRGSRFIQKQAPRRNTAEGSALPSPSVHVTLGARLAPPEGAPPLHGSVGLAFQDNLEHRFLDAAPASLLSKTPKVHAPLFFQAKNFKWTRMMQMWESNPDLVNCTTSKMRWAALMQASYVAR